MTETNYLGQRDGIETCVRREQENLAWQAGVVEQLAELPVGTKFERNPGLGSVFTLEKTGEDEITLTNLTDPEYPYPDELGLPLGTVRSETYTVDELRSNTREIRELFTMMYGTGEDDD